MDLSHDFEVPLSIDETWAVLTDLERVAPCLPGAQLEEVEGDEYRGKVKIKVGPITVEYKGTATFLERVPETHVAVLRAQGRETKGQGSAAATVTATLSQAGASNTKVNVLTVLDISGRVAQFGRGALADVSSKILGQFAANLEKDLASGTSGGSSTTNAAPASESTGSGDPEEPPVGAESSADGVGSDSVVPSDVAPSGGDRDEKRENDERDEKAAIAPAEPSVVRKVDSAPVEPVRLVGAIGPVLLKRLSPVALIGVLVIWLRHRRHKSST